MNNFVFLTLVLAVHLWATHQMDLGKNYYAFGLLVLDFLYWSYLKRHQEEDEEDEWEMAEDSTVLDEHYETLK